MLFLPLLWSWIFLFFFSSEQLNGWWIFVAFGMTRSISKYVQLIHRCEFILNELWSGGFDDMIFIGKAIFRIKWENPVSEQKTSNINFKCNNYFIYMFDLPSLYHAFLNCIQGEKKILHVCSCHYEFYSSSAEVTGNFKGKKTKMNKKLKTSFSRLKPMNFCSCLLFSIFFCFYDRTHIHTHTRISTIFWWKMRTA